MHSEPLDISSRPVVIVGAGVTGLTMAHLLAEAGVEVVVLEKQPLLGGLARSFRYDGFVFDVGPHRFYTENAAVDTYLQRILAEQSTYFPRLSEVFLRNTYYRWPLHPRQLVHLPLEMAFLSGLDLLANTFREHDVRSFEDYVIRQYGPTLYAHFFRDYTLKFLGVHPAKAHPDWAKAGINRAIIDDNLQMQNLTQLLKSTLLQFNKANIDFLYPRDGMFIVWDHLARRIEELGGRVLTGVDARLEPGDHTVAAVWAHEERIEPSLVIWTGTINRAISDLHMPTRNLPFRALLLYNVMVEGRSPRQYQWCYYGESELLISRVSIPRNFSAATCPPGTYGLCVEVTAMKDDVRWAHGENLTDWVVDDLVKVGMVPSRDAIHDIRLERVEDAYPIYHINYPEELKAAQEALQSYDNLQMAGRNGTFWYNNMDHCIEASLGMIKRILRQAGHAGVDETSLAAGSRA